MTPINFEYSPSSVNQFNSLCADALYVCMYILYAMHFYDLIVSRFM